MIVRGLAGPADEYPKLYASLRAARAAAKANALASLSGSMTMKAYAAAVGTQAANAAGAARDYDGISSRKPALVKEIRAIAAALAGLASAARAQATKTPNATITPKTAYRLTERLQSWYDTVTGVQIGIHAGTVGAAAKLPGQVLEAAKDVVSVPRKVLGAALGVPQWMIPVLLAGVGAAVLYPYAAPMLKRFAR